MWFSSEGEQSLENSYTVNDSVVCTEKVLQDFSLFLIESKV